MRWRPAQAAVRLRVDGSCRSTSRTSFACCGTLLAIFASQSGLIMVAGQAAVAGDMSYNGSSFIPPKPSPGSSFAVVQEGSVCLFGAGVLNRTAMTRAFNSANAVLRSLAGTEWVALRWTDFIAHPSQTAGLANYTALVQSMELFAAVNATGPDSGMAGSLLGSFSILEALNVVHNVLVAAMTDAGLQADALINYGNSISVPNATLLLRTTGTTATIDMLSRIEVTGYNLLPFYFDMQTLMLSSINGILQSNRIPVGMLNVSSWRATEATTNNSRRLLVDSLDVIQVEVWATLFPAASIAPETVWYNVSSPNPAMWEATKPYGAPMNITFLNATSYQRLNGSDELLLVSDSDSDARRGLSPAGIAGTTVGVVVALAVGLAALLFLLKTKRRLGKHGKTLPMAVKGGSSGTAGDSSDRFSANSRGSMEGQIDPNEIEICKHPDGSDWLLGQGNFGKVFKATRRGTTEVAVKKLSCVVDEVLLHQMRQEVSIMRKVSFDQNIVQFYGACLSDPAMLCMEYMEGGDLKTTLFREKLQNQHQFDWYNKGKDVALAVARGLHFLHTSGVIHRDVKSSNVLLTKDGVAKVSDVGLAVMIEYFSSSDHNAGTFTYAAPELLMGGRCTPKVDVFSYGVLLWELVTKEPPRRGHLRELRVPQECPPEVAALIADCGLIDMNQRPSMKDIVQRLRDIGQGDAAPHILTP